MNFGKDWINNMNKELILERKMLMLNPLINKTSSSKADLDGFALYKYNSLPPAEKEIVKLRANEVIRLVHERADERGTRRQPLGFNSALSLLLVLDTLKNQEDAEHSMLVRQY